MVDFGEFIYFVRFGSSPEPFTALASGHNSENPAQALKHRTAVKSNKSFSFIEHYLTLVGQPQESHLAVNIISR